MLQPHSATSVPRGSDPAACGAQRRWRMGLWAVLLAGLFGAPLKAGAFDEANGEAPAASGNEAAPAEQAEEQAKVENPFPNAAPAPGLEGGTDWLNTSGEITLKDLRGKVVLLDFWTLCCINCMHVLPDLAYLEKKFPNELVVIGVHSAKFDNEKDSEVIRDAIVRYEIEHPVINDANMIVWRKFGARAWPTLVLLDPEGNYCGYVSGEGNRELMETVIGRLIAFHRAKGTLDETPFQFHLEKAKQEPTPLRYPGKVLADAAGNRLFISDSNHNRIVISTLDGKLLDVVGSGAIGAKDGAYAEATFDHPQGMELVGDLLYVADTENHLLRVVDLKLKRVSTLAGTGSQARFRSTGGTLKQTALNSPWDLEHVDGMLYIAMAGPHQIWSHKLGTDQISVYAGSGRENITDGSLAESALAQPSGLDNDGRYLYVADSEGSAIRSVPLDPNGDVTTVVGTHDLPQGRSLFEFGDVDGVGDEARLQHPLAVAYRDGTLYVADSYNHKIKRVDLKTRTSRSWLGTGEKGRELSPAQFSEPAGLDIAGDELYIADTNNHRICVADLKSGQVRELTIAGLEPPKAGQEEVELPASGEPAQQVAAQRVAPGKTLNFEFTLELPEGFKLNPLAPAAVRLRSTGPQQLVAGGDLNARRRAEAAGDAVTFSVPLQAQAGTGTFEVALTYSYCRDGVGGLCKIDTVTWSVPVQVAEGAPAGPIRLTNREAGK